MDAFHNLIEYLFSMIFIALLRVEDSHKGGSSGYLLSSLIAGEPKYDWLVLNALSNDLLYQKVGFVIFWFCIFVSCNSDVESGVHSSGSSAALAASNKKASNIAQVEDVAGVKVEGVTHNLPMAYV